jgi:TPR repeat protein
VKDEAEAARYYKFAADQNDADVQFNYAVACSSKRRIPSAFVKTSSHSRLIAASAIASGSAC